MFTHLHVHSEYSLLDGACRIEPLVDRALELGQTSLAVTDHGVMYGIADFYKYAKKKGLKPILGCEMYTAARTIYDKTYEYDSKMGHLVLLAENDVGYHNLIKLVSIAHTEGFYYKPRTDFNLLKKYSEGIIAMSACLAGDVPQAILNHGMEEAEKVVQKYLSIFGRENFVIELQNQNLPEQMELNARLVSIAKKFGLLYVATNDAHYLKAEDAKYQDVLMCIEMGKTVDDPNRMKFQTEEFYLKSEEEMLAQFEKYPEAIQNTQKIAERCNVELRFGTYHLPKFKLKPGIDSFDYLKELCYEGLKKRYENWETHTQQLDYELGVIRDMGFTDYFLIVWDFIKYAKDNGISVGPGRGSAAGSLVSYCLDITTIDPIQYSLLFERFLNPERISMPDIDIDFCYERRGEVIDYVVKKYGKEQVAQIVTFGTLGAKAAIRDVGRALNVSLKTVNEVAKLVPFDLHMTLDKALKESRELSDLYQSDFEIKNLIDTAKAVEGMPRHTSTHAAGVVITEKPVSDYVPLQKNDEVVTTQFTMTTLEEMGLLKMDFLGLRNLTIIAHAVEQVNRTRAEKLEIEKIDYGDKETYRLIASGNTNGIFQLESSGMKQFLKEFMPSTLEDIIAAISLYRPGPMQSIPTYIKNKRDPSKITYLDPVLKPILETTYGCIVYQEQVMQIVQAMAGYSLGRADLVRRAMSKKKHDVMERERQIFIYGNKEEGVDGCVNRGISVEAAKTVFDDIADFASYAFNKSHAAAYAVVAYRTAYLKCHYPVEFMAAMLTSILDSFDKIPKYIEEAKGMGISVLPYDINHSHDVFTVENGSVRFGLAAVKNVGRNAVLSIVKEREDNGLFSSFADFIDRMHDLNKRMVESLIKCGAFDCFGNFRSQLLAVYEKMIDDAARKRRENIEGQISLLDFSGETIPENELPAMEELTQRELLAYEKEVTGFYLSGNPLDEYRDKVKKAGKDKIDAIQSSFGGETAGRYRDNDMVILCGVLGNIRLKTTKSGSRMAFSTLSDYTGTIEMVIFPKIYGEYTALLQPDRVVVVHGRISAREENDISISAEKILDINNIHLEQGAKIGAAARKTETASLQSESKRMPESVIEKICVRLKSEQINQLNRLIEKYSGGSCPLYIYYEDKKRWVKTKEEKWLRWDEAVKSDFCAVFGNENVKIVEK